MADSEITHSLFENASLLLALATLQWLLLQQVRSDGLAYRLAMGLLFGLTAVATMLFPLVLEPGLIFDTRTVALSIGSLFGGPVVGLVAGAIAATARIAIGGTGTFVGLGTIAAAVLAGLAYRRFRQGNALRLWDFLILGILVNGAAVSLFAFLPTQPGTDPLLEVGMLFLPAMVAATVVLGFLMREIDRSRHFARRQAESAARFERLFRTASVSLWEEDASRILQRLRKLRQEGETDLRRRLERDPDLLASLMASLEIRQVNDAALRLFRARSGTELTKELARTWGPDVDRLFIDLLCSMWEGKRQFSGEAAMTALDGTPLQVVVSFPVPQTVEEARQVAVSMADVTGLRAAQQAAEEQRIRLQEIIRATNVATWEWNVQTGATTFDEHWAEMVGHTLDEISPVSIETWRRFCHPDDLARSDAVLREVLDGRRPYYECELRMRHRDGHWVWVLDRGQVVEHDPQGRALRMSGTHADISERKATEMRLARIGAIREAVLHCQSALFRQLDEKTMLQQTCDLLVQAQDYALVWIGIPEQDAERNVRPVARAGRHAEYVDRLTIRWGEDAHSQGPSGMAVKTRSAQVQHDLAAAQAGTPRDGLALAHGFRTSAALPLAGRKDVLAVLNVYSLADESFDTEEIGLLSDFAGTLALVLENIRAAAENRRMVEVLSNSAFKAVGAIAKTIEKRDPYTSGHQQRVAGLAANIAARMGWDTHRIDGLRLGALIHDIGKISVPAEILNRPGHLSDGELSIIRAHPSTGAEILADVDFPWPIRDMVEQHHERLDGSGYPRGLKSDEIVEEAKILAVADVVEAMVSHRPYRPSLGLDRALEEIAAGRGTLYDPAVVDACIESIREDGLAATGTV